MDFDAAVCFGFEQINKQKQSVIDYCPVPISSVVVTAPDSYVRGFGNSHGQFSKFIVCFCGLDSGNLKFETVRTNTQHICF